MPRSIFFVAPSARATWHPLTLPKSKPFRSEILQSHCNRSCPPPPPPPPCTAVWEAAHADEIAAEQTQREQLPRLVLLDFVRERQRRRPIEPVLITSLMKDIFLLQKEGTTGQTLYHFVPYKYGPFARELYQDLEALAVEGFIAVTESDEERTEIALAPSKEATVQEVITKLPENLRADVTRVLEQYGHLSHNQLLATVYEKFPAHAPQEPASGVLHRLPELRDGFLCQESLVSWQEACGTHLLRR